MKAKQWDAQEAVQRRLKQLPEVCNSYAQSSQIERDQLHAILMDCEEFRHDFGPKIRVDTVDFAGRKSLVQESVRTYLENPWMHSPSLTGYLASTLIDTDIAPLAWPPGRFAESLWLRVLLLLFSIWAVSQDQKALGWIALSALFYLQIVLPTYKDYFSAKHAFLRGLWAISEELDSGHYDGETLLQRLKKWEEKYRQVNSQVYSLLRLPSYTIKNGS